MGTSIEVTSDEIRLRPEKSEVERLWADTTKAKEFLDWEPIYGGREGFQRGLAETIGWFTQAENLRLYKSAMYNL
jgi:dTDP-glucose 4,6-dehydratase